MIDTEDAGTKSNEIGQCHGAARLIDRRLLLKAGTLGLGALAAPGGAALLAGCGFTHDVASGEPHQNSVMLWTRYVPSAGGSARLDYELSEAPDFSRIAAGGSVSAEADHDWCVKAVADGLSPGRWYHYRFRDAADRVSPVGRTRTLPDGPIDRFRIGIFSCSNLPFGWFNAYAHAAARSDLDLIVHLGDYLYEYERGRYPSGAEALAGRLIHPAGETIVLADYRLRHAAYRADADLRLLHRSLPMVMMWDDHESANDSWKDGAENHQPESEGDWQIRKQAAERAYREWLPVSDRAWERYEIGELATLFRTETRLTARDRPLDLAAAIAGREDVQAALADFRDGAWRDPERNILGREQEAWLADGLRRSVRRGARWQVLAQQVIMGSIALPEDLPARVAPDASEAVLLQAAAALAASRAGLPLNLDAWDGYPAARARLLDSAQQAEANLVVLSGDSHNAWAFELGHQGEPAGVDIAVQSVTSPGFESFPIRATPDEVARAFVERNDQLLWADTSRRGYLTLELTPERATAEWLFLETVRERSTMLSGRHTMSVGGGTNRFERI